MRRSNYDRRPRIEVPGTAGQAWKGWEAAGAELRRALASIAGSGRAQIASSSSSNAAPGSSRRCATTCGRFVAPDAWIDASEALRPPSEIERVAAPWLGGDDPLFGFLANPSIDAYLDPDRIAAIRARIASARGTVVVFGTGALRCAEPDILVYADMPRWEGQLRQRQGRVTNLGIENAGEKASLQYKRSYFVDWRMVDGLKRESLGRWDYLLDSTIEDDPRLVSGRAVRRGLEHAAHRPFRLVPFFDPAPWGGQWMKEVCGLDPAVPNYGWCFDCVPEENSLLFDFGGVRVEMSSLNLVFSHPRALLGADVFGRFGAEFPIRFDFLDTMGGGHLSLQVHPLTGYIRDRFGVAYTQDESYYLMDAGPDATVFLGLRDDVDPQRDAGGPRGGAARRPLVSGGTPRCEVARPPPRSLPDSRRHGSLLGRERDGARGERDALHLHVQAVGLGPPGPRRPAAADQPGARRGQHPVGSPRVVGAQGADQPRDRRRARPRLARGTDRAARPRVHRDAAALVHAQPRRTTRAARSTSSISCRATKPSVESPDRAFDPFVVHYAETFVVPASVGRYTIRPHGAG